MAQGVKCRFFGDSLDRIYTYLVGSEQPTIVVGDHVVVHTPTGEFKVVEVMAMANDTAPVPRMKFIVQRVDKARYFELTEKRRRH